MAQGPYLGTVDLTNLDTSNVVDMSEMFYNSYVQEIILDNFNTSNVESMALMFSQTQTYSPLDLSSFSQNKTTDMSQMFYYCLAPEIDISNLDTSHALDMQGMFAYTQATVLDVSNFDTSNVTDMTSMFLGSKVTMLDMSSFDTSNVENMSYMFSDINVEKLDISNFDTSKVVNMSGMFSRMKNLHILDVSHFNTSKVSNMECMFMDLRLDNLDLSSFDTSNVTNMYSMFSNSEIANINLSNFNTSNVTDISHLFSNAKVKNLDLSNFDTRNVKDMQYVFNGLKADFLNSSNFSIKNAWHVGSLFANSDIKVLDLSNADFKKQINKKYSEGMFVYAKAPQKLILGENFKFFYDPKLRNSVYTEKGTYSFKWSKEDHSAGPYTSEELYKAFNENSKEMAGTWVAESFDYTIHFDPNGASGSMEDKVVSVHDDFNIPEHKFNYFGKKFVKWTTEKDGSGKAYKPEDLITTPLTNTPETITLYAQWEDVGGVKGIGDNMYEVYIPGNSKVTIKDLPAGLSYEIYEETEKGWVLVKSTNATGTIKPKENTKAQFINEKTNDKVAVSFEGKKLLDGKGVSGYKFEILQDGKVISTATSIDGSIKFEPIVLNKVGNYKYTIREVDENNPAIVYDTHEEQVEVVVTRNMEDNLTARIIGDKDGIVFKNSRKKVNLELDVNNWIPNKYLPNGLVNGLSPYETDKKFSFKLIRNDNIDTPEIITLPESGKINIDVNYGDKLTIEEVNLPKGFRLKGFNNTDKKSVTIDKIITDTKVKVDNIYEPRGMFNINVSKNMIGRNAVDGEFFYQVKAYDIKGNIIDLPLVENKTNEAINLEGNTEMSESELIEKIKNDAKAYPKHTKDELANLSRKLLDRNYDSNIRTNVNNKIFDDIMFARIGTQYIAINELPYNINLEDNIEFDSEPVIAKIKGKDNGDGTIATTIEYINKKQAFNNSLKPGKLQITKVLEGDNSSKYINKEFKATIKLFNKEEVELTDSYKAGDITVKSGDSISLIQNKPIVIEGLPDGATYEIIEDKYDYFELSDKSMTKGKIEAGKTAESKIINIFKPSGKFEISINKKLENADIKDYSFNFLLVENDKVIAEAKSNQEGRAILKTFDFTIDDIGKEFKYNIVEGKDNNSSIIFDDTVYNLKFKVVEKDGRISAVIDGKEEDNKVFTFTNKYINTASIKIFKTGEGEKPLSGIEFELLDSNKENIIREGQKVILTTGEDGYSNIIKDLQVGKYYLKELNTPEGYLKEDFIEFEIEEIDLNTVKTVRVVNRELLVLPVTGLPNILYIVISLLSLIICAYIFDRKSRKIRV